MARQRCKACGIIVDAPQAELGDAMRHHLDDHHPGWDHQQPPRSTHAR